MASEREKLLQEDIEVQKDKNRELANDNQILLNKIDAFDIEKMELNDKITNLENDNCALMK